MESHDETGCQVPKGPVLCINNCGFFGSEATMNMCSKCFKDSMHQQEQAQLAASSIGSIVNGNFGKEPVTINTEAPVVVTTPNAVASGSEPEASGPKRCTSCRKRVGLTGFKCKCGDLFCSTHRYSDKHECPFDYRAAAQDAISKSNPVVKADKINKI
ncbi:hypothetical protein ACFE04_030469 [Oxalis oulophora]